MRRIQPESLPVHIAVGNNPINFTDPTGEVRLSQLKEKLATGPIFIGENHAQPHARKAISQLINEQNINERLVKSLSLELPFEEGGVEMLSEMTSAFDWLDVRRNKTTHISTIIKPALQRGVDLNMHDTPLLGSGETLIKGEKRDAAYAISKEGITERNKFSARVISQSWGREEGVIIPSETQRIENEAGTIILAGEKHLNPAEVENGNTLQKLLGYDNDRVFDLTKPLEP